MKEKEENEKKQLTTPDVWKHVLTQYINCVLNGLKRHEKQSIWATSDAIRRDLSSMADIPISYISLFLTENGYRCSTSPDGIFCWEISI